MVMGDLYRPEIDDVWRLTLATERCHKLRDTMVASIIVSRINANQSENLTQIEVKPKHESTQELCLMGRVRTVNPALEVAGSLHHRGYARTGSLPPDHQDPGYWLTT